MNTNTRKTKGEIAKRLSPLLAGGLALLLAGCGRDVLVGTDGTPSPDGVSGLGGGRGSDAGKGGAPSGSGGTSSSGGVPGSGGIASGTGGVGTGGQSGRIVSSDLCATISTVPGQPNACGRTNGVAFSPDGLRLATVTESGSPYLHIWRLSDGVLLHEPDGGDYAEGAYDVAFSPDSKIIATAGYAPRTVVNGISSQADTDTVSLWDAETGLLLRTLPTHCGFYADAVAFSHDGKRLVTAGYSAAIEIWNVADGTLLLSIPYTTYSIYSAHFSPDDTRLVTASAGTFTIWNASDGTQIAQVSGFVFEQSETAYSPNGQLLLSTGADGQAQILDKNGVMLQALTLTTGALPLPYVGHVAWIDDDHVVADDWSGNVKEWKKDPGQPEGSFAFVQGWTTSGGAGMAVSPDQKMLVVGDSLGFTFFSP